VPFPGRPSPASIDQGHRIRVTWCRARQAVPHDLEEVGLVVHDQDQGRADQVRHGAGGAARPVPPPSPPDLHLTSPVRSRLDDAVGVAALLEVEREAVDRARPREAANELFRVVCARTRQRSTLVVTNLPFKQWGEFLPSPAQAVAIADRLVDDATIPALHRQTLPSAASTAPRWTGSKACAEASASVGRAHVRPRIGPPAGGAAARGRPPAAPMPPLRAEKQIQFER